MTEDNQKLKALLSKLDSMSYIKRCGLYAMNNKQNLAEHSYGVVMLSLLFFDEIRANVAVNEKVSINLENVLILAAVHDFNETITTDIPWPLKREMGEFIDKLDKIGDDLSSKMLSLMNNSTVNKFFKGEKSDWEYAVVKLADSLDLFIWAYRQKARGEYAIGVIIDNIHKIVANNLVLEYSTIAQSILRHPEFLLITDGEFGNS